MTDRREDFLAFMRARHEIWVARDNGKPWPWTDDTILRTYKFCNVYRELDKVTIWIREHIREPFHDHPQLWFMLCIARQINLPESLEELMSDKKAWPHNKTLRSWQPERLRAILNARIARGERTYTGAYMLNNVLGTHDDWPRDKPWFTAYKVLGSAVSNETAILAALRIDMRTTHAELSKGYGWGGFTAYEVVSDLRWTRYGERWPDINTFAHAGPGAARGLARIYGRPLNPPGTTDRAPGTTVQQTLDEMIDLLKYARTVWPRPSRQWPRLELREIEHSLCEFDKYERVRLGEGRPRSLYHPPRS
jgi:hypothetical protein